jgi:ribosomal-protein-serine acetyltransferase
LTIVTSSSSMKVARHTATKVHHLLIPTTLSNVQLRPPTPADASEMVALVRANLDHLAPWMPWAHPDYGHRDYERWLAGDDDGFVIVCDSAIVGSIGFNRTDPMNRSTSIGYWLAAEAQGRGIVTEAVQALVRHAFGRDVNRVELRAAPDNARSQAVAERCGFTFEGVARGAELIGGRYRDLRVYARLASD